LMYRVPVLADLDLTTAWLNGKWKLGYAVPYRAMS